MKNTEFELDIVRSHADVLHSRKKAGTLRTFYQALRRLLYALGGKATDADNTDVTLIERMAEVAEGGGISPSASGLPNHDKLVVMPGTSIGSVSGESRLAKLQRAISQGVIPIGKPFTGYFTSGARYYCDGFLYYSNNKLYGYIDCSTYSDSFDFRVIGDDWESTHIGSNSTAANPSQPIQVWKTQNGNTTGVLAARDYIGLWDDTNQTWIWRTPTFPSESALTSWPVSMGGTGATTVSGIKTNLGLGSLSAATQSIANNATADIPIASSTSGAIITSGAAVGARDFIWFNCNSSGTVSVTQMRNANGLTVTAGTNKVTIANASGAYCYTITLYY